MEVDGSPYLPPPSFSYDSRVSALSFLRNHCLLSSLLSLIIIIPLVYLSLRDPSPDPILGNDSDGDPISLSAALNSEDHVNSEDELGSLSKAIGDIGVPIEGKIEEISKEKEYLQAILKGMARRCSWLWMEGAES